MTPEEKILRAHNMLEIEFGIYEVWYEYSEKFAKTHRPFVRARETQQDWISAVVKTYGAEMTAERNRLFALIPERFKKTIMYNQLESFMQQINQPQQNPT